MIPALLLALQAIMPAAVTAATAGISTAPLLFLIIWVAFAVCLIFTTSYFCFTKWSGW
jgi:hypothetical protein